MEAFIDHGLEKCTVIIFSTRNEESCPSYKDRCFAVVVGAPPAGGTDRDERNKSEHSRKAPLRNHVALQYSSFLYSSCENLQIKWM